MAGSWSIRLALVSMLVLPGRLASQTATSGTIAGMVRDTSGAVVPGVTVEASSPALIEKARTVVTDDQGRYAIVDLRPGTYAITFTLQGFNTVRREGLEVTTGFTSTLNAEMRVGAVEETVTVSGASPVVDVQNIRQQNLIPREVLDALPQAKSLAAIGSLVPGVMMQGTRGGVPMDVGGSIAENPTLLALHGGRGEDQALLLDGMRYSNGNGAGPWRTYFVSSAYVEEVQVETSGMGADTATRGVQVNVVPKEGGNTFHTSGSFTYTNSGLHASNLTEPLRARGLTATSPIRVIYDHGGGLGGPIKTDRLWLFTSHRWWGSAEYVPGNYFNRREGTLFYEPELTRPAYRQWNARDHSLRLTWQAAQKHKIAFFTSHQGICFCYLGIEGNIAPEASTDLLTDPSHLEQATWTFAATNRLLFQAGVTYARAAWHGRENNLAAQGLIPVTELSTGYRYGANSTYPLRNHRQDQGNTRFSLSYITGSHAFKVGTYTMNVFEDDYAGGPRREYQFLRGFPVGVMNNAYPHEHHVRAYEVGLYVQDQWTIKRLTVNIGGRFDHTKGWAPEQTRPAGYFTPEIHFATLDEVPNWKDVQPRLGAVYDVSGNGKTAIKVFLGRYVESMAVGLAAQAAPAAAIVRSATQTWADSNGDYLPQESELGPLSNSAFGTVVINRRFADDSVRGWGSRGYSWAGSVAVQQELRPGVALNVGWFRTSYGNFRVTDNTRVTSADFDHFCFTTPVDARLPDGGGQRLCGLYDIKSASFGAAQNVVTLSSNFGRMTEVSNFVDASVNARFGRGGQIVAGLSTGRTDTNDCAARPDSPNSPASIRAFTTVSATAAERFCEQTNPWAGQTQIKMSGVYPLPWNVQVSAVFQNLSGPPRLASYVATNAEIAPELGRNLGACGVRPVCTSTFELNLIEPFSLREKRISQLDLRVTKLISFGRVHVRTMFDVYNLLNADGVSDAVARYGPTWLRPTLVQPARLAKFGAQVNF